MSVMICLGNPRTMEEIKVMIFMFVMIVMIKRTTMTIVMMIPLGDDRGGGSRW